MPVKVNIKETNLDFGTLSERRYTDMIIVHHTGSEVDCDPSAAQIHQDHKYNNHWSGIGYHLVVRKDGTIERGRPIWAVGAHAGENGMNAHSVGVHLSGSFDAARPTEAQIESTSKLIAYLCEKYNIPTDRQHIKGHREVGNTGCPGKNLFALLDTIVDKAAFYFNQASCEQVEKPQPDAISITNNATSANYEQVTSKLNYPADIEKIAILARKYESRGDPACVSNNAGDLGGMSYGLYQFASNVGTVEPFVKWLCSYPDEALANYGRVLAEHKVNSEGFVKQWQALGTIDPGNFGKLQDEYVKTRYYDVAADKLAKVYLNVNKHTNALKAVVFARAVQNGPSGCAKLFEIAVEKLGHPNLSYVDTDYFDGDLIGAVYDYLIVECDLSKPDAKGIWRSPDNFCHGSKSIILALRSRFIRERADALAMLTGGFHNENS